MVVKGAEEALVWSMGWGCSALMHRSRRMSDWGRWCSCPCRREGRTSRWGRACSRCTGWEVHVLQTLRGAREMEGEGSLLER